jgi:MFS family permease
MIFAVAMTFIDQTIVSIAVPQIQRELGLSSTGVQWAVNAYLLSLAACFAFGGRLCGLTPSGSIAEAWIVAFRVATVSPCR